MFSKITYKVQIINKLGKWLFKDSNIDYERQRCLHSESIRMRNKSSDADKKRKRKLKKAHSKTSRNFVQILKDDNKKRKIKVKFKKTVKIADSYTRLTGGSGGKND